MADAHESVDGNPSDYDRAYDGTRLVMGGSPLSEVQEALNRLATPAKTESEWGVVDGLSDLVREIAREQEGETEESSAPSKLSTSNRNGQADPN